MSTATASLGANILPSPLMEDKHEKKQKRSWNHRFHGDAGFTTWGRANDEMLGQRSPEVVTASCSWVACALAFIQ